MITPPHALPAVAVGRHYDDLDRFYREIWGEHVHHGLWERGDESPEEAVLAMSRLVCERAEIRPGHLVCDVGSGYGATSRYVARECGAEVTALTVSRAQYEYALTVDPMSHNPSYLLADWLVNRFSDSRFDAVLAIESTEHMGDKARCFWQMERVLKPGGRAVICAWLAHEDASPASVRMLLEPICREGRLPGLGTSTEYRTLIERAGLVVDRYEELSEQVRRTWSICIGRLARGLLRDPSYRHFLLRSRSQDRVFVLTMLRMWLAYSFGSLLYGVFTARKPVGEEKLRLREKVKRG